MIEFNFLFGQGYNTVDGNFSWGEYEGNFYGSNNDINANGFNARGGGYTSSYGDFSTNINGKFYGNEISSVGGNINITDSLNILEGTFSANKQ